MKRQEKAKYGARAALGLVIVYAEFVDNGAFGTTVTVLVATILLLPPLPWLKAQYRRLKGAPMDT